MITVQTKDDSKEEVDDDMNDEDEDEYIFAKRGQIQILRQIQ